MNTHQHYEELCALAVTGQMPESEVAGFRAHLADCPGCSALLADFAQTGAYLVGSHAAGQRTQGVPNGMTERFIARARTQGIAISMTPGIVGRQAKPPVRTRQLAAAVAVAAATAALVLLVVAALVVRVKAPAPQGSAQNTVVQASDNARREVSQPTEPLPGPSPDELAALRAQVDALTARLKANREAIGASQREKEDLQARLAALEAEKEGLKSNDSGHVATISSLQANMSKLQAAIDKMNSEKAANDVANLAEENELRVLRVTLAQKEAALEQQRHLLEVGSQVRDFAVTHNLQMFDVYDADGDGNQQRAVGRIFYIPGKSLTFYAFDLSSPRTIHKQVSFYAWGERLGGGQPVKKLGILHNEDVQRRALGPDL